MSSMTQVDWMFLAAVCIFSWFYIAGFLNKSFLTGFFVSVAMGLLVIAGHGLYNFLFHIMG